MRDVPRRLVQRGVKFLFSLLPESGQRVLPLLVQPNMPRSLLDRVLAQLPIESLTVRGLLGVFEGAAQDASIIQRYAFEGTWSPNTLKRILSFFEERGVGTYIDVGANIGLTTIPVAKAGISVLAFEPVPKNYQYLCRNVDLNDTAFSGLHNVALLDRPGQVTFELSPNNFGDHRYRRSDRISEQGEEAWETVLVRADVLDSFVDSITGPVVLKIDTQGSEPLVISGGKRVCAMAEVVICEFSPYAMNRMGVDPEPLISLFEQFPEVELFEGELDARPTTLSGNNVRSYLAAYALEHKLAVYGRYLNIIGRK